MIRYTIHAKIAAEWHGAGLEPDWKDVGAALQREIGNRQITVSVHRGQEFTGSPVVVTSFELDEAEA